MDSDAQGRDGPRLGSRLKARQRRHWATLGSAAAAVGGTGLDGNGVQGCDRKAHGSDCCARLMVRGAS